MQFLAFNSEAIIYIYEQLLKKHYLIFKEGMRMKKHKVLTAVFTRRGLVHVRCTRIKIGLKCADCIGGSVCR